ncbi:MAG: hypothetical protein HQ472_00880 [Ignavibacteria bacterium]|nr:hypothetical protein [Ignavibacteria bacterium]
MIDSSSYRIQLLVVLTMSLSMLFSNDSKAQVAKFVWANHIVCSEVANSSVSSRSSNGSILLALTCDMGVISSTDFGISFSAKMSPENGSLIPHSPALGFLCERNYLIAGTDNSLTSHGSLLWTQNNGNSWEKYPRDSINGIEFDGVSGRDSWMMTGDGFAKSYNLHTTDCGNSWSMVSFPDNPKVPNDLTYQYIGNGRFVVKSKQFEYSDKTEPPFRRKVSHRICESEITIKG